MLGVKNRSTRRSFLLAGGVIAAVAGIGFLSRFPGATTIVGKPGKVNIVLFSDAGERLGSEIMAKLIKSNEEWIEQLSNLAFRVTRQEGTERPFSWADWDSHDGGVFRCVCCDTALFNANAKYDSGTGWPSFWQPITSENIVENADWSSRTSLSCTLCDAHLGHVFNDGPQPTGLRYCINGVALRFAVRPIA